MSDAFMRNMLKKRECTEYILQVIMDQENLSVAAQTIQKDYKNLYGRSAILDCVVRDTQNRRYDIEIQQDNEGGSPKRARYHSGLMDMHTLKAGQNFEQLPEGCVIFITRDDSLGRGIQAYHIDRKIRETQDDFNDGAHIIYINSKIQDDTKLGRLMHDLHCKNADEMYSEILAERMRELKETEKGVEHMCSEMDKLYNEGVEAGKKIGEKRGERRGERRGEKRGERRGRMKAKREMALSMAAMGMPAELIAQAAKESLSAVQQWIAEGMAVSKTK
ncbi:MAG TPA: PD-(D/E)XK nuclease family transposase [Candidatus Scybalocola faecipullorum]|nr:PD-(D/E)XK nuclease family transposase [Candidatus Scybalocola faecipullorum]